MDGMKHEIDGANLKIDGANHVKWIESQYRWSESYQVLCSLVKPNIGFFSHVKPRRIYGPSIEIVSI